MFGSLRLGSHTRKVVAMALEVAREVGPEVALLASPTTTSSSVTRATMNPPTRPTSTDCTRKSPPRTGLSSEPPSTTARERCPQERSRPVDKGGNGC